MKKILECDVDGVLLDIYTPAEIYFNNITDGNFKFANEVKTWGMTELGNRRGIALESLTNSEVRKGAKFYNGAVEFVRGLCTVTNDRGYEVVLNTVESNSQCAYVKNKILTNFMNEVGRHFTINIQVGRQKEMLISDIVIEDSIPNIERSTARIKLLKDMFHNTSRYNLIKTNYVRCNNYRDIFDMVVRNIE